MKLVILALLLVALVAVDHKPWTIELNLYEYNDPTGAATSICYGDYLDIYLEMYKSYDNMTEDVPYDDSPTNIDWIEEIYCFTPVKNIYGKFTDFGKGFVVRGVDSNQDDYIAKGLLVDGTYVSTMFDGAATPDSASPMCVEDDTIGGGTFNFVRTYFDYYPVGLEFEMYMDKDDVKTYLDWTNRNNQFKCYHYWRPIASCETDASPLVGMPEYLDEPFDLRQVITDSEPLPIAIWNDQVSSTNPIDAIQGSTMDADINTAYSSYLGNRTTYLSRIASEEYLIYDNDLSSTIGTKFGTGLVGLIDHLEHAVENYLNDGRSEENYTPSFIWDPDTGFTEYSADNDQSAQLELLISTGENTLTSIFCLDLNGAEDNQIDAYKQTITALNSMNALLPRQCQWTPEPPIKRRSKVDYLEMKFNNLVQQIRDYPYVYTFFGVCS